MKDESSQRSLKTVLRGGRTQPPSRKLNFLARVRRRMRHASNRLLAADKVWSVLFVSVVMLLVGSQRCGPDIDRYSLGDVAERDIPAAYDVEVVDQARTLENWGSIRESVPPVYVFDAERDVHLSAKLSALFEEGRGSLEQAEIEGQPDPAEAVRVELSARVPEVVLAWLIRSQFNPTLERELTSSLTDALSGKVVGNRSLLVRQGRITLTELPGRRSATVDSFDDFVDLDRAATRLRARLERSLDLPGDLLRSVSDFTASFLDANVYLDAEMTERRREEAVRGEPPVRLRIARGELLIRKGESVTPEKLSFLDAARDSTERLLGARELVGVFFIVSMLAFFLYRYSDYHQRAFSKLPHLHALLVVMLLSMLLLSRSVLWLAREVVDNLAPPFNHLPSYTYLIPLGAGAILVALLANGRIATVYAAFASLLFGAINGADFYAMTWAMLVQLSGVYAISTYRERAALLRAGLVVGGAGAVTAIAVETLEGQLDPLTQSLYGAGLAFVGGAVGVGLLISFSLPLLERLFNVLTDIRLLELSNVNNPLLSELAVRAPGSYNHSLVVGTLAEEAAKAIGANSLFCRVAAFYHDIGKVTHAEYYVENQRGSNPHDRLLPSMSALIIASHVKDGIKLAREAGLPEQIIDIIPQHHGTKLMTYFYEKARNSTDPSLGPVKEEDFRYPGPKPQTREAAIFMLADAVEAAARTVDDPAPNRLREMIRKVTNAVVLDGQLDNCDLTFADLDRIQQAFLKLLVSMYHHRVDYPGFDFGKPKAKPRSVPEVSDRKIAKSS